ncbi:sulfatase-like hydrolase/transferase [Mariniradius sediminis]|uniref:Sulfatase-like hydrolase/transferase n=1 Tax=Mariniradius sediminis TaxID=2909237 RepID=A0ABS9BNF4_9BACT|nr:sulfatase-like hydrolase/transferase [Mariniradius sediminis]MCF1749591.1 sulfatase-like hydrolase/transferase [Mariniradius sediminis]
MRILLPFFLLAALIFFSCNSESQKDLPPPNILWISTEDIDPAWGGYGDEYAATPNIDGLAADGFIFTRASANSPICAPARSTLITGMYATSLGTQHLRSDVPLPNDLKILPEILREHGYYTSNNVKTDYNFSAEGRWDDSSKDAHWRNRKEGQPFFSVVNFMITHEGPTNNDDPESVKKDLKLRHDPAKAPIPPYFPDTPKMREIIAHAYDLISIFDQGVGELVQQLKDDGLYDNTIIFVFSDHGFGLPRHKRWLTNSGLHIPLVLHVPEKYRHLVSNLETQQVDDLVGFVDFAPTVLGLAGIAPSSYMEGNNFLGPNAVKNQYNFGFRSRADDCHEMSRSVSDGRYLYIRHYLPQLPYIQNAIIFTQGKQAMEEIYRARNEKTLPNHMEQYFHPKMTIELYDLEEDPYELNNLAMKPEHQERIGLFQKELDQWMVKHRDSGMLNESEYMLRAKGSSVYEILRDDTQFDPEKTLEAMNLVGQIDGASTLKRMQDQDPLVRYWGLIALEYAGLNSSLLIQELENMLDDPSPINAIQSAKMLIQIKEDPKAYQTLGKYLQAEEETTVLHAAIALRLLEEKAQPLIPLVVDEIYPKYAGEVWGRYKSWSYPMFIGMALDQARINCGEEIRVRN